MLFPNHCSTRLRGMRPYKLYEEYLLEGLTPVVTVEKTTLGNSEQEGGPLAWVRNQDVSPTDSRLLQSSSVVI